MEHDQRVRELLLVHRSEHAQRRVDQREVVVHALQLVGLGVECGQPVARAPDEAEQLIWSRQTKKRELGVLIVEADSHEQRT